MTTEEIALKFKRIFELKRQMRTLQIQRRDAELALNVQYKVDECNQAKNTLALNFQTQLNDLSRQIYLLEDELGV